MASPLKSNVELGDDPKSEAVGTVLRGITRALTSSDLSVLDCKKAMAKRSDMNPKGISNGGHKRVHTEDDGYAQEQRKKKACTGTRTEYTYAPYHDGYQWRKYGQKMIRGNAFPRCYYRCTYHQEYNCLTTKHVQQHNYEDPPLFRVIYTNEHTCNTVSNATSSIDIQQIVDAALRKMCKPHPNWSDYAVKEEEKEAHVSSLVTVIKSCDVGISIDSDNRTRSLSSENSTPSLMAKNTLEDVSLISPLLLTSNDLEMDYLVLDSQWFEPFDLDRI